MDQYLFILPKSDVKGNERETAAAIFSVLFKGKSSFLTKSPMDFFFWVLQPGSFCVGLRQSSRYASGGKRGKIVQIPNAPRRIAVF